jgi:hypothetical protein
MFKLDALKPERDYNKPDRPGKVWFQAIRAEPPYNYGLQLTEGETIANQQKLTGNRCRSAMYDAVSRLVLCKQVRDNVMQTKLAILAATVRL